VAQTGEPVSRRYDAAEWDRADIPNRCLSAGSACLYGLCEAAILTAGYAPAIGFLDRGKPQRRPLSRSAGGRLELIDRSRL
jgi:CRISPR/Cas system-associated endonuclease Cas1